MPTDFDKLSELCTNTPALAFAEYSKLFKVHMDASGLGLWAVLYQTQGDGPNRVISYASRTLSKGARKYPANKIEFLALKWAVTEQPHEYLYRNPSDVHTDNNPLTHINYS